MSGQAEVVSARVVKAYRGGLRVELDSGGSGWIRRNDLPAGWRAQSPAQFVGTVLRGLVTGTDEKGRGTLVSPRHLAMTRFQRAQATGERLSGSIVRANRGGLVVAVDGHEAFAPRSELRRRENADHWSHEGRDWRGWVLSVKADEILLSSYRPSQQRRRLQQRRQFVEALEVGQARAGRVHLLSSAGAFVSLHRSGVHALVPARDLPSSDEDGGVPHEGEHVKVRIAEIRPGGRHGEPAIRASLA